MVAGGGRSRHRRVMGHLRRLLVEDQLDVGHHAREDRGGRGRGHRERRQDALAHRVGQSTSQIGRRGRPQGMATHGHHGRQLGEAVVVARRARLGQAQHGLARQHGIEVGLPGGAVEQPPLAGRRLRRPAAGASRQVVPRGSLRPGAKGLDGRLCSGLAPTLRQRQTAHRGATGQRPDTSLTQELRVKLDPWLESTEVSSSGGVHPRCSSVSTTSNRSESFAVNRTEA